MALEHFALTFALTKYTMTVDINLKCVDCDRSADQGTNFNSNSEFAVL